MSVTPMNVYSSENSYTQIYSGGSIGKVRKKTPRVIAFDLDETLGSFMDLEVLWQLLLEYPSPTIGFNEVLDMYPEFLRRGILPILEYLVQKKKTGECQNVYIYTNNQCSVVWVDLIAKYFDYKLGLTTPLFDRIINAFKINNVRVEMMRTSHDKTHRDFIKCTLLPKMTQICFVDNSYFDEMAHRYIYYIQPRSYFHKLSKQDITLRFLGSKLAAGLPHQIRDRLVATKFSSIRFHDHLHQAEIDIFVAQKIMYHIKEFFLLTTRRTHTKKFRYNYGKKTRKIYSTPTPRIHMPSRSTALPSSFFEM